MKNRIARWESQSGKHFVDLFFNPAFVLADGSTVIDAHYRGNGCGGSVGGTTPEEAIAIVQRMVDAGTFLPDSAKRPMTRIPALEALSDLI